MWGNDFERVALAILCDLTQGARNHELNCGFAKTNSDGGDFLLIRSEMLWSKDSVGFQNPKFIICWDFGEIRFTFTFYRLLKDWPETQVHRIDADPTGILRADRESRKSGTTGRVKKMARFEKIEDGGAAANGVNDADVLFRMGMMYATGRSVETDLVTAHKWFNIAASQGHRQAAVYRQEIAEEMSVTDVAAAQRAAREWLRTVH